MREHKNESHRLSNMLNEEQIGRVKKKRHREHCMWEKQVKTEIKRVTSNREKDKESMVKFLKFIPDRGKKRTIEIEEDEEEDMDMRLAVREGLESCNGGEWKEKRNAGGQEEEIKLLQRENTLT